MSVTRPTPAPPRPALPRTAAAEPELLPGLVGALGAGLVTLDARGRVRTLDATARGLLRCGGELIGRPFFEAVAPPSDAQRTLCPACHRVRSTQAPASGSPPPFGALRP